MDVRKIVVVVEDVEAARTALQWALHNLVRCGDVITLLHVYSAASSRSRKKLRLLRLRGYQLALSFKDVCSGFPNTNIEIVVAEGDQEGVKIASMVREMAASALVVGLHGQSFLYKLAMTHDNFASSFNCRVLAIRQPPSSPLFSSSSSSKTHLTTPDTSSINLDFSQVDMTPLDLPDIHPPKIPYRICPDPSAIIWRSRKPRRRRGGSSR
ncbi:Usp domain-containing protein [Psidium guajava]|nr:Usp domain-containing protein [Psidium guajava]